jgi:hypothetical protein
MSYPISTGKWVVVSFGSHRKWHYALKRLARQVQRLDLNLIFLPYGEKELKRLKEWSDIKGLITQYPKGYGLWVWKPLIILDALDKNKDALGVIYLDAGCEINVNDLSKLRFQEYLNQVLKEHLLVFEMKLLEYHYTNHEVIKRIYPGALENQKQISAAAIFVKNSTKARKIIEVWQKLTTENDYTNLIGDDYKTIQEKDSVKTNMISHRHDQSILSLVLRKCNVITISDETYWAPDWNNLGKNYPIWVVRNHRFFSVTFLPCVQSLIRKIKQISTSRVNL